MTKWLTLALLIASPVNADGLRIIAVGGHYVGDTLLVDIGVRIGEPPQSEDKTITLTIDEAKDIIKGLQDNIQ